MVKYEMLENNALEAMLIWSTTEAPSFTMQVKLPSESSESHPFMICISNVQHYSANVVPNKLNLSPLFILGMTNNWFLHIVLNKIFCSGVQIADQKEIRTGVIQFYISYVTLIKQYCLSDSNYYKL